MNPNKQQGILKSINDTYVNQDADSAARARTAVLYAQRMRATNAFVDTLVADGPAEEESARAELAAAEAELAAAEADEQHDYDVEHALSDAANEEDGGGEYDSDSDYMDDEDTVVMQDGEIVRADAEYMSSDSYSLSGSSDEECSYPPCAPPLPPPPPPVALSGMEEALAGPPAVPAAVGPVFHFRLSVTG